MKTQLIPLEPHDDLISVRDRMSWAKVPRILLIWPQKGTVLLRPLDFKVLQRHARALGTQLGLVTRKGSARRAAQALGIPVFRSTGEAQRKPWPKPAQAVRRTRRRPQRDLRSFRAQVRGPLRTWQDSLAARIGLFSVGVLAVLVLVSLFVPRAEIHIVPRVQTQGVTLPVRADASVNSVFINGSIPARSLRVTVAGSEETAATGKITIPQRKATAVVTFRNLTLTEVTIPVGVVLTSVGLPGVRFVTTEQAVLPGNLDETVDVPVEAEQAGRVGNVEAGAIQAIEGSLGLSVAVTNAEVASGGSDRTERAPSQGDVAALREQLLEVLQEQALETMQATLQPGDELFVDTLVLVEVLGEVYNPPPGQPGAKLSLELQAEFEAFYASSRDLTELAETVLNASLPPGFVPAGDGLTFTHLKPRITDAQGVTRWTVRVERDLVEQIETRAIVMLVSGRSLEAAQANLQNSLPLAETPVIEIRPPWWPWLPLIPFNVQVVTP